MAIGTLSTRLAIALFAVTSAGAATAWADDDDDDGDRGGLVVGPQVQVSDFSPLPPFSVCGNFPGNVAGAGVNFINSEVEPWLDVNPTDPDNLVAYWQQDRWSNGGSRGNVAAVSLNGGQTWTIVPVPGQTDCTGGPFERASDPWVTFAPDGTLHQMSLVFDIDPPATAPAGFGPNGMTTSRSTDGGITWTDPILIISDTDPRFLNDKNSMTADPTDSNFVYAVWDRLDVDPVNIFGPFSGPAYFARTVNGGVTWEPAVEIFNPGVNNQVIGSQIVVLPDGTLLNFFNKIVNVNADGTTNPAPQSFQLTVIRSDDRGATWDVADGPDGGNEIAIILGGGATTPDQGIGVRDGSIIFDVAVDPDSGDVYAVWQDFRFTGFDQIAFSQSEDGGATWTNPVRINATPANPDRPFLQQAFLPSIAVGGDGTVVASYYDFRNDEVGPQDLADHWMIFCDRHCDDPSNWVDETRLTDISFDYNQAPFANGLFLGDYVGLAAIDDEFLAFFQESSIFDSADGFFRKIVRGGDDDDDEDDDDDDRRFSFRIDD